MIRRVSVDKRMFGSCGNISREGSLLQVPRGGGGYHLLKLRVVALLKLKPDSAQLMTLLSLT